MATKEQVAELVHLMENEKEANQAATEARDAITELTKGWSPSHFLIDDATAPYVIEINEKCRVEVHTLTEFDDDGFGL